MPNLPIGDDSRDGDWKQGLHLPQQRNKLLRCFTQEAAGQEDLTRQTIVQNPEDFMTHTGFQPIDPQDDLPLWEEAVREPPLHRSDGAQ
jgi:hypothetical protein